MKEYELIRVINEAAASGQRELDLRGQNISELPSPIWRISSLEHLNLNDNKLTRLPPEVGLLKNLITLKLSQNYLTKLPAAFGQLEKLTVLDIQRNQLTELPPEIGQLEDLGVLVLSYNNLTSLPSEIGKLKNLIALFLVSNRLRSLPPEITQLSELKSLWLNGNELPIPPEILAKYDEPAIIINYYLKHRAGDRRPLNEAKVLVVGQGSVGKTSLVKRLVSGQFNPSENKTEGIDIQKWQTDVNGQSIRLNMWDFGGQEIMHATHQFFLTKRSLYLLVVDARVSEEDNRIEYWLKLIQSFGKDSPVVVVGNKVDQQRLDLNRSSLQVKYPNIKAFVETSCQTGEGLDQLRSVVDREIGALGHIHDPLLVSWFSVKERLEQMKEDYIPYQQYVSLCVEQDIGDELSQNTLIGFLHDLGIVLNFRDDPPLEETNILNPEWVTSGVYKILNSHVLFQNKGVLERRSLVHILDPRKYPKDKHLFIMDMMRKFELCFNFEGLRDERFLIPDLLTREEPYTGDWDGALAFQYHYNVLPSSIISRFIVRMHQSIYKNTLWRTGVVLKNNGNKALVKADIEDRKIFIWVGGPEDSRRRFLEVIRSHFDSIHKTIPGIVADEKVPLPAHPEIAVDYKHLLRLELKDIPEWIPEGLDETVNVKALLDGIETEQARRLRQEVRLVEDFVVNVPDYLKMVRPPPPTAASVVSGNNVQALDELTRIKNNLDSSSETFAKRCLYAYLLFLIVVAAALAYLNQRIGWDKMEFWTCLVGFVALVGSYAYFAVTQREASPKAIFGHIIERKKIKNYKAAGFDLEKYERLTGQSNT